MKITRLLVFRVIFGILLAISAYIILRDFRLVPSENEYNQLPMLLTIPVIVVNFVLWLEPQFSASVLGDR